MREASAARSGRDFKRYEGKGRKRGREGAGFSAAGVASKFVARNPGAAFAAFAFLVAGGAIAFNALSLQDARHPAPLFSGADAPRHEAARVAAPQQVQTQAPVAVQILTPPQQVQGAPNSIADLVPPPPPARPGREAAVSREAQPSPPLDPIAALIRGEEIAATTGSLAPEPDPRLLSAQRALANLGYGPLNPDGLDGPVTREALRRFEQDQGLAVTGSLNAETARALAIRSGVRLD